MSSARLASLGKMAGGIAHEINNPLAIIHASADDLLRRAKQGTAVPFDIVLRDSERIYHTADRIATIIKSMLRLTREGSRDKLCATPVAKIVEESLEVCRLRLKEHAVKLFLPVIDPELRVPCREVQIAQVLVNLLQNACDAVLQQTGEKWIRLDARAQEDAIVFSVIDSGTGIPPELKAANHGTILHY